MKIKNIQLKTDENFAVLLAECKIRYFGYDKIYFKFEKKHLDFICADASPFAAALLVPSMKMGQDLVIDGAISEKLYEGMQKVMKIMVSWNIGLKPISVIAKEIKKDDLSPSKSASFFSGGVDSFFTYLRHNEEGEKKIQYLILVDGFDINLENRTLWNLACETVEDVAKNENIEVIKAESNIRDLIEQVALWDYTHGGCLAAVALALRKELKNVYIPSSLAYGQLLPWGSHPELDPLWSTETLHLYHDGAETKRVDKVKFISKSSLALKNLRVCYINEKNKFNCGVCDKCLRTMMNLYVAGALEKAETFPHKIDLNFVRKTRITGITGLILHNENLEELEKLQLDPDLQNVIRERINDFYHHKPDLKEIMKLPKYYLLEFLNKIRLIDFFYDQDRLYKKYVSGKLLLRKQKR